jgi:NAD(P)-dependent dehydrogenase (short-subunit alcohol dehydrogenase family)
VCTDIDTDHTTTRVCSPNVTWTPAELPDLSGTIAIVTGANSGIGWHTAMQLAAHGARVVMACRDEVKANEAADRVRAEVPGAEVAVEGIDLSSMASIRNFADRWQDRVDLLVNNAGVMAPPSLRTTVDGFELQFGTNHLGHFVLTGLLLPSLLSSTNPRVVTVASTAHHTGNASVVDGNLGGPYHPQRSYGNSKLANLLFAFELQRLADAHGQKLTSVAAHPGVAATGLVADRQGMGANPLLRAIGPIFLTLFTQSAAIGARATLYAATEAEPGSYTGPQKWSESRGPIGPARLSDEAKDEKLAHRLWQVSEEVTGLHYPWP